MGMIGRIGRTGDVRCISSFVGQCLSLGKSQCRCRIDPRAGRSNVQTHEKDDVRFNNSNLFTTFLFTFPTTWDFERVVIYPFKFNLPQCQITTAPSAPCFYTQDSDLRKVDRWIDVHHHQDSSLVSDRSFPPHRSFPAIVDSSSLAVLDIRLYAVRDDGPYSVPGLKYREVPRYVI